jgi:alpha-ketoglutarate-dependent taurine dioxygenase
MPDLSFRVDAAAVLEFAAVPALQFNLRVDEASGEAVQAIMLNVQIRIAPRQRLYSSGEQDRLQEVFGAPAQWAAGMNSLLWAQVVRQVPRFSGSTEVDLVVPCSYDFEVASNKYFDALEAGEVPLEFLFSGTVFYTSATGLQAAPIPWEKEASFRLPVATWRAAMEHYFPGSAWIRLRRDVFDRLYQYRVRAGFPSWEGALERLLEDAGVEALGS